MFTGVTYAQLATLRVRVYGNALSGSGYTESVDSVGITVSYTPAGATRKSISLLVGAGADALTAAGTAALLNSGTGADTISAPAAAALAKAGAGADALAAAVTARSARRALVLTRWQLPRQRPWQRPGPALRS